MSSPIETLPFETLTAIIQFTPQIQDRLSLSSTSKLLRRRLAPLIFRTVIFSNRISISGSALLAAKAHRDHIRVLQFIGCSTGLYEGHPYDVLPDSARSLFNADKELLPNLEQIRIKFEYNCENVDDFAGAEKYPMEGDIPSGDWLDIDQEDRLCRQTIRTLWSNTYTALSETRAKSVQVVIENWSSNYGSTLETGAEWKRYLGTLDEFEVSLTASDILNWKVMTTLQGYPPEVASIHRVFFEHLTGIKRLRFGTGSMNMNDERFSMRPVRYIGVAGAFPWTNTGYVPFPLSCVAGEEECMPLLQEIELRDIYLSQGLVDFIASRKRLRKVVLSNAKSWSPYRSELSPWLDIDRDELSPWLDVDMDVYKRFYRKPLTWEEFFDSMCGVLEEEEEEEEEEEQHRPRSALSGFVFTSREFGYDQFPTDCDASARSSIAERDRTAHARFVQQMERRRERLRGIN
ncbi:hypothetical protein QBC43DRAFT_367513 [Cladorrhinum sp. PSN259]|nr:hypothetical protein QBC43DRAFT_367513 [Cladorrhinum sp. PSN259]